MSKVWFITGASRGLGLEISKAALDAGDKVVATVRSNADALQSQLNHNDNLHVVLLDVTNEAQAHDAMSEAVGKFGQIDVLVNNAGYGLLSAIEEASGEEVKNNYNTNVFGTLNVIRAALPHMRKQRSGHIVNISSVGGLRGAEGWGLYASTKFAIEGITETLAIELAPLGIHATAVEPGYFRTDFLDTTSLTRTGNIIEDYADTVGKMRSIATQVNKKQPGDPKKLAQALLLLVNADKPPVHLPLGKDTLQNYREKTANFHKDIEAWHDVIVGTDHDDVN
ncbi:oxidoreductase [Paenibacillus gorillae]|uniref:oxidoreductase n=1 Tax=Paenibacillus gorillae TaxID=1243662 RepID=UPI0004BB9F7A|nr:oxidoreductase [Paenibacillus gorillae]